MSGRRTFLGNAAAATVITKISSLRLFGSATENQETINPTKSDREKAGLRGPVKTCVEERTGPPDGTKYSTTTEYGPDGRLLTTQHTGSDGSELVSTRTYDTDGRLIKTILGRANEPGTESIFTYDYHYDEQSHKTMTQGFDRKTLERAQSVIFSGSLYYGEQGRKTMTQGFGPETLERAQNASFSGSLWNAAVAWGVGVPVGGNIQTIYNDQDLPTEAQLRDAQGRIATRIVRSYDLNGRIIEENQIQENPALLVFSMLGEEGEPQFPAAQLEVISTYMKSMLSV